MNILFIASGFPPTLFSENLVNGKLVLAFLNNDWNVDVISKNDIGSSYSNEWDEPFSDLREITNEINYEVGSKITRILDLVHSTIIMDFYPLEGVRWAKRAYFKSLDLMQFKKYDIIITRSPSDIPHLVGYKLSRKTNIPWIANWNDPALTIWPAPYSQKINLFEKKLNNRFVRKIIEYADIHTFPSENLRDHFKKFFPELKKKNVEIIPHIALLKKYLKRDVSVRSDSDPNTFRMLHAGNLSVERDPELLFEAIANIKMIYTSKICLDIMGVINGFTQGLIDKYQLQNEVHFIGSSDFQTSLNKMKEYDILLLLEAKVEEGIFPPGKLVDYSQSGKPIWALSPPHGYVKNMLLKTNGGLYTDNSKIKDIEDGLKKLIQLKQNNLLKDSFSSYALASCFNDGFVIGIYNEIFQNLIGNEDLAH